MNEERYTIWRCPWCGAEAVLPTEPPPPGGPTLCTHSSAGYSAQRLVPASRLAEVGRERDRAVHQETLYADLLLEEHALADELAEAINWCCTPISRLLSDMAVEVEFEGTRAEVDPEIKEVSRRLLAARDRHRQRREQEGS